MINMKTGEILQSTKEKVKYIVDGTKEICVSNEDKLVATAAVAIGTGSFYLLLTAVKIKWLVLAGLCAGTGVAAAIGYKSVEKVVNNFRHELAVEK